MKAISNFFNGFNTFLNNCVSYVGSRIITGKFIEDIKFLITSFIDFEINVCIKTFKYLSHVNFLIKFAYVLRSLNYFLLQIPFFSILYFFLIEIIKIIFYCYSELFIIFAITFPASILLLDWFQTSIIFFCIAFIPYILGNIICFSALYYCIYKRESGEKISLWESINFILRHIFPIFLPIIVYVSVVAECVAVYIFLALSLIFLFTILNLPWSNSFIYLFVVIFSGTLIFVSIFTLTLIIIQTYFTVLFDSLPFHVALKQSVKNIKKSIYWYIFLYIILLIFCTIFTWHAFLLHLYLGLSFGIYLTAVTSTFLGYLLRKKFSINTNVNSYGYSKKLYKTINIIIIFGLINYSLLSNLLIKEYQPVTTLIQTQQDNYLANQNINTYVNHMYGYSIQYPMNWSMYQWQNNSVTFYNNYTQTLSGGTWMTITINPSKGSNFTQLYDAIPGVVPNSQGTGDETTKITNMSIQGYHAVNYLQVHPNVPYTDYESHYVINKGLRIYDISFTSVTNDIGNYNSDLFTKIISSFQFIQ